MVFRFASNLLVLIAGAVLTAASLGFGAATAAWVALGVGCFAVVVVLAVFPVAGRGGAQRLVDLCAVVTGAWTIVSSRTFGGVTQHWLVFAEGALLAALGVTGLLVHESLLERAVRQSERPHQGDGRVTPIPDRPTAGAVRASR